MTVKLRFEIKLKDIDHLLVGHVKAIEEEIRGVGAITKTRNNQWDSSFLAEIEAPDIWDASELYHELRITLGSIVGNDSYIEMPLKPEIIDDEKPSPS